MKASNSPLERKRPLLFAAGLLFAFSVTLVSFEWRTPYSETAGFEPEPYQWEESISMPITLPEPNEKKKRPDSPKEKEPRILDVLTEPIVGGIDELTDLSPADFIAGPAIEIDPEPDVDDGNIKPLKWSSQLPEYCNGGLAMNKFIQGSLKYPEIPRSNGVSGTVGVQFVVGKDGKVRDVKIIKPVDPWLDAEALRVTKMLDCFIPGKQAGKPVAVYFKLPIKFKLL